MSRNKSHNIHDKVQLEYPILKIIIYICELMKSFKNAKFVRMLSIPTLEINNDRYGHTKLLETREFVVESYQPLTEEQLSLLEK